ncbi:MAG: hypothetical protein RLO37_16170 [Coleofasciculus chthonoplastes F1-TOW-03]
MPATTWDLADYEKLPSQLPDLIQSDSTRHKENVALLPLNRSFFKTRMPVLSIYDSAIAL